MKKLVLIMILSLSFFAATSFACSTEEAQDKAVELNTKLQQLAEVNPGRADEISGMLQEESIKKDGSGSSAEAKCELYDKLLAVVDKELG